MQLHCPPTEAYSKAETYSMMDQLVQKGKIKYYGVSVETVEEAMEAIKYPNIKSVQIIFNIFRQKPAEVFFKEAAKKDIGIIIRVPLASGLLTGKMNSQSTFPSNDHRNYNIQGKAFDVGETFAGVPYNKGIDAVEELKKIIPEGFTLADMSLKWILSHPEVTVVIPGAKNSDQAQLNTTASDKGSIDNVMEQIQEIYKNIIKPEVHHRW
jgi:aryl-alcohol dehydrogenase-like predicted oxidoreductase